MISVDDLIDYAKIGATAGAFVSAAILGRSWIKKQTSGDSVSIASDDAERGMLKRAMDEADHQRTRADTAFEQRNDAVSRIGALEEKIRTLEYQKVECDRRIAALESQIDQMRLIVDRRARKRE